MRTGGGYSHARGFSRQGVCAGLLRLSARRFQHRISRHLPRLSETRGRGGKIILKYHSFSLQSLTDVVFYGTIRKTAEGGTGMKRGAAIVLTLAGCLLVIALGVVAFLYS